MKDIIMGYNSHQIDTVRCDDVNVKLNAVYFNHYGENKIAYLEDKVCL